MKYLLWNKSQVGMIQTENYVYQNNTNQGKWKQNTIEVFPADIFSNKQMSSEVTLTWM